MELWKGGSPALGAVITSITLVTIFVLVLVSGDLNTGKNDGSEITLKVKRIIVHEQYSRHNFSNNIALLHLAKPVKINNFIRTVRIPPFTNRSRSALATYTLVIKGRNNQLSERHLQTFVVVRY